MVLYGLIPIAGAQLCYYNAVAHMSVGVALLLEYTAPVMVVGWIWATTRRRPSTGTLAGVALAIAGIMLVLNIFGGETNNVDTTGVIWGLTAAVCAVFYFMMSDRVTSSAESDADGAEGDLWIGAITRRKTSGDFDGDGKSDVAIYRPATGIWYVLQSSMNNSAHVDYQWGVNTDKPVPGDYDGDGKTDVAI